MEAFDYLLRDGADLLLLGKGSQAMERAQEALESRPGNALAENLLGLTLYAQKRFPEARRIFESLIRRHPDLVPLRVNAGIAAYRMEDADGAQQHLGRVLSLEPYHARTLGYLALVQIGQGHRERARLQLERAGHLRLAARLKGALDEEELRWLVADIEAVSDLPPDSGDGPPSLQAHEVFVEVVSLLGDSGYDLRAAGLRLEQRLHEPEVEAPPPPPPPPPPATVEARELDPADAPTLPVGLTGQPASAQSLAESATVIGQPPPAPAEQPAEPRVEQDEASTLRGHPEPQIPPESLAPAAEPPPAPPVRQDAESPTIAGRPSPPPPAAAAEPPRPPLGEASTLIYDARARSPERLLPRPLEHALSVSQDRGPAAELHDGALLLRIGEMTDDEESFGAFLRQDLMLLCHGDLAWEEAQRRCKGADKGALLCDGAPVLEVTGTGTVLLHPGPDRRLELLLLTDEALYVQEGAVAAWSSSLYRENGRIPGLDEDGPGIIQLRGQGHATLLSPGEIRAYAVNTEELVIVRLASLLGWTGEVVPQPVLLSSHFQREPHVGCTGTGKLLLSLPGCTGEDARGARP